MIPYRTPVDVANEALQHCGAARMDAAVGFGEDGVNAAETSFSYDKQRQGELKERYWTFAIKHAVLRPRDANMMMLAPALWSASTTYFAGSIVADQSGNVWISNIPQNLNNDPLLTTFWEPYCGPMGVPLFDATIGSYYSGELVYKTPGDGTNKVYQSLVDGNSDDPATATAWDGTVTYFKDQVVTRTSVVYKSLIDLNLNQDPASAPALWAVGTTYSAGARVGGSDGIIYTSVGNGNVGHDPTLDNGTNWTNTGVLNPWTTVIGGGAGSVKWLEIGGSDFPSGVALTTINTRYPVGAGPSTDTTSRNVFVLPGNYLRRAPQDPKRGTPSLGGPSGLTYDDWMIEKPFLISRDALIVLRFVADITDVSKMDTLFCQVVATRIAFAVVDKVTQSLARKEFVAKIYTQWRANAHLIDGVEQDYDDQPDDDLITVRA